MSGQVIYFTHTIIYAHKCAYNICKPYYFHVPIVLKSGSLNLLEPSGPVQACNGIALPLPFYNICKNKSNFLRLYLILLLSVIVITCIIYYYFLY